MNHKSDIKMDVDNVTPSNMVYPGFGAPTEIEPLTYDYLFNKHKGLQEECFKPDDFNVDEGMKVSVRLGFPLKERINMEHYVSKAPVVSIDEANAKVMLLQHGKNGYIIVSPCGSCRDVGIDKSADPKWRQKFQHANTLRIGEFLSMLIAAKFSYTPVYGGFVENYGTDKAENVYERSFMVYAHDRDGKPMDLKQLYGFGLEAAKKFNQDSFLYKAPGENPKWVRQDGEVDMEYGADATFYDFSREYFSHLHKNREKLTGKNSCDSTKFTFVEAYVNPASDTFSSRAPRHYKGEVFVESSASTKTGTSVRLNETGN